jgi:hypothetical protein
MTRNMMKRPLLTLITLLLCTKAHGSSVIRWDAAHVKELEEIVSFPCFK